MQSAAARLPQSQVSEQPQSQLFEEEHVAPPGPTWHSSSAEIHVSPHGFPIQHTGFPLFDMFSSPLVFIMLSYLGSLFLLNLIVSDNDSGSILFPDCEQNSLYDADFLSL